MISKKHRFLLCNSTTRGQFVTVGSILIASSLVVVAFFIQKGWGEIVQMMCGFYTLAISFFFGAQVWGFMASQTEYSNEIEEPKFELLEREAAEWNE